MASCFDFEIQSYPKCFIKHRSHHMISFYMNSIHRYKVKIFTFRTPHHQSRLTTEELRGPKAGRAPGVHLFGWILQPLIKETSSAGLVAHFTSSRPFPQAEEATSHKNVKTPVSTKSCGIEVRFKWSFMEVNINVSI